MSNVVTRNGSQAALWYAVAAAVLVLDQYTKGLASAQLSYNVPKVIYSWFNITLHHNYGAAFSFLGDAGGWQRYLFTVISAVVSLVLFFWLIVMPRWNWLLALSVALVLGGALGNLWDRVQMGYVVDFISVHYKHHFFPTFNIADAAITGGAIGLIIDSFIHRNVESD